MEERGQGKEVSVAGQRRDEHGLSREESRRGRKVPGSEGLVRVLFSKRMGHWTAIRPHDTVFEQTFFLLYEIWRRVGEDVDKLG